nr:hydrogenase maturation nickel metallochaperone HypA [Bilophila wadsworthia]
MERHAPHRLLQVRARYGALANIVPEALSVAFEALTAGTDWEGAVLQAEEIPLSLKCSRCGQIFSPARQKRFSAPCPFCGEEQGHSIGGDGNSISRAWKRDKGVISWKYQLFATFLKPTKNCRHV